MKVFKSNLAKRKNRWSSAVGLGSLLVAGCTVTKIDFGNDPIRLTIIQRHSKAIPGSRNTIKVKIGDIIGGQVLLSVHGVLHNTIVDLVSVEPGDVVPIPIGKNEYSLRVIELRNLFMGDDFGVFEISDGAP